MEPTQPPSTVKILCIIGWKQLVPSSHKALFSLDENFVIITEVDVNFANFWTLITQKKVKCTSLYRHWGSVQAERPIGGVQVQLCTFMTTALEGGEGSASRPGPLFTPRERLGTYCTGGWMDPRAGLDKCGQSRLNWNSIPGPSSP
jgi:hypothetical protein